MKLTVLERLMSIQVLSEYKEGNFITFKTIKELRAKLFPDEEEVKKFDLCIKENKYFWNSYGNEPVDLNLTEGEIKLLKDKLEELNAQNKLVEDYYSLYELIIGQ